MEKSKISFFVTLLIFGFTMPNLKAQITQYSSSKNLITKANGAVVNISNEKVMNFFIRLERAPLPNDLGYIKMYDGKSLTQSNYSEEFTIYKTALDENGVYEYWAMDKKGGQIVLFEIDKNSAIETITMHRYGKDNSVLKTVKYFINY